MPNPSHVVLVVEDHPIIRICTMDLVRGAGYEPVEAENADAAITELEARTDVGLVLTDVSMPGTMNGLELANYIHRRWPPVRLIVVSGRIEVEQGELPPEARFFSKPYSDDAIIETMTAMLGMA